MNTIDTEESYQAVNNQIFKKHDIVEYTIPISQDIENISVKHKDSNLDVLSTDSGVYIFKIRSPFEVKNAGKKILGEIENVNKFGEYAIKWLDDGCLLHSAWWNHCNRFKKVGERRLVMFK
jgi:hypothetical protein